MDILKKIVEWYMKAMKFFLFLVKLSVIPIVLLIILSFSPIVPKIYYLIYNYNFSYNRENVIECGGINTCINDIKWEKDNLIVSGTYGWGAGYEILPNSILGFYKIKDNDVNLYITVSDGQLGILELIKRAKALAYRDKVSFKFTIKNLSQKDYKIILNDFEQWSFSTNGEKEILYENFCKKNDKSYEPYKWEIRNNDGCWRYAARKTENPELCFNMSHYYQNETGDDYIENCVPYAVGKKEHIKYCFNEKFKVSETEDLCLKNLGIKLKDVELCDTISNSDTKNDCLQGVALGLEDIKICDRIKSSSSREGCWQAFAVQLKEPEICDKVSDNNKYGCILAVAKEMNDPEVCNRNEKLDKKDYCLMLISFKTEDSKICDRISTDRIKKWCVNRIIDHEVK